MAALKCLNFSYFRLNNLAQPSALVFAKFSPLFAFVCHHVHQADSQYFGELLLPITLWHERKQLSEYKLKKAVDIIKWGVYVVYSDLALFI